MRLLHWDRSGRELLFLPRQRSSRRQQQGSTRATQRCPTQTATSARQRTCHSDAVLDKHGATDGDDFHLHPEAAGLAGLQGGRRRGSELQLPVVCIGGRRGGKARRRRARRHGLHLTVGTQSFLTV